MESDENSSADEEERINFLETIQHCDILVVPKKPAISSNTVYELCTNTTIQLKPSSFSAFRGISEVKHLQQCQNEDKESVAENDDDKQPTSRDSHEFLVKGDPQWIFPKIPESEIVVFGAYTS